MWYINNMSDGITDAYRNQKMIEQRATKILRLSQTNTKVKKLVEEIQYHEDSAKYHIGMARDYNNELTDLISKLE